jgi:hypothetical protein
VIFPKSSRSTTWSSEKASRFSEKASRIPVVSTPLRSGTATIERIPRTLQTSGSTRLSLCASSQRKTFAVRKHSPEIPESTLSGDPSPGAMSPLRALHTTTPWVRKPMATALAPVRVLAASAIARKSASEEVLPSATAPRKTVNKSSGPKSPGPRLPETGGCGSTFSTVRGASVGFSGDPDSEPVEIGK